MPSVGRRRTWSARRTEHCSCPSHLQKCPVWPIIVIYLNNNSKRRVLQIAEGNKEVKLQDTQFFFDHNFTFKVRQQRSQYKLSELKAQNIKTHILTRKTKSFLWRQNYNKFSAAVAKDLEGKGLYKVNGKNTRWLMTLNATGLCR